LIQAWLLEKEGSVMPQLANSTCCNSEEDAAAKFLKKFEHYDAINDENPKDFDKRIGSILRNIGVKKRKSLPTRSS
jgi:hypothetical protein